MLLLKTSAEIMGRAGGLVAADVGNMTATDKSSTPGHPVCLLSMRFPAAAGGNDIYSVRSKQSADHRFHRIGRKKREELWTVTGPKLKEPGWAGVL